MKDLIFVVSFVLCGVLVCAFFGMLLRNYKKFKTARYFRICRNLCMVICISAFICTVCLPSFSFSNLFFPISTVPIFFINAKIYHKCIASAEELEIKMEMYLKSQPIDVEYQELD